MTEARERTEKLLKSLDGYISGQDTGLTGSQALHMIRWMNSNLEKEQLQQLIKELDLYNADVIEYLLDKVELDPTRYN